MKLLNMQLHNLPCAYNEIEGVVKATLTLSSQQQSILLVILFASIAMFKTAYHWSISYSVLNITLVQEC